jgi:hypothetical protein
MLSLRLGAGAVAKLSCSTVANLPSCENGPTNLSITRLYLILKFVRAKFYVLRRETKDSCLNI